MTPKKLLTEIIYDTIVYRSKYETYTWKQIVPDTIGDKSTCWYNASYFSSPILN